MAEHWGTEEWTVQVEVCEAHWLGRRQLVEASGEQKGVWGRRFQLRWMPKLAVLSLVSVHIPLQLVFICKTKRTSVADCKS